MHDPHPRGVTASRPAHVDTTLNAWVLSQHADVLAALKAPALVMPGTAAQRDSAHLSVRDAVLQAWTPDRLAAWRIELEADAVRRIDALPAGESADLVQAFAEPWSLGLALLATGAPRSSGSVAAKLARELFLAAASATSDAPHAASRDAAVELSQHLASAHTLGEMSGTVQAFVALSQTLPSLLASAWLAILGHDELQSSLRAQVKGDGHLSRESVNELLRTAGPAQAVFREVLDDVTIRDTSLHAGDRVALMLDAANHDAARFADPMRVDCTREGSGHFALGAGPHACAGASLVRMALDVATSALLRRTSAIELD